MMYSLTGQKIYLIGIKGVGLTMLAQFLAQTGNIVSGSDIADVFLTDQVLKKSGIKILSPFAKNNIPDNLDMIVYSSAYNVENNSELAYLKKQAQRFAGVKILSYGEALGEIFNRHQGIAVCGSHGKTTVSAWLGYVLAQAGLEPNVLVGSRVPQFQGSGLAGQSKLFIAEVDEYQNKLRYFQPRGVILNNIDYDHPDFFKSRAAYTAVFRNFIKKIPVTGFLVVNQADIEIGKISKFCRGKIISYDIASPGEDLKSSQSVDYLAYAVRAVGQYQIFKVRTKRRQLGEFKIKLLGQHNIANAVAVIIAARQLGAPLIVLKKGLAGFKGTERRAQILGRYRQAIVIDDYAHHPTEIKTTLAGLRAHYPDRRLVVIFHPHTFTRTRAFFSEFTRSFTAADELIILDIYSSAREKQGGVSSKKLVQAIVKFNREIAFKQAVTYLPTSQQVLAYLRQTITADDLLVLMGAGDVFRIGQDLLS